jgi:hypothetical protein
MPRKYVRKSGSGNLRSAWKEENLRETIKAIEAKQALCKCSFLILWVSFSQSSM